MRISNLKAFMVSMPSAVLASLCCVLPLALVVLGIGSGTFMMTTMKYSNIFIPIGVVGVGLGYFFYGGMHLSPVTTTCSIPPYGGLS